MPRNTLIVMSGILFLSGCATMDSALENEVQELRKQTNLLQSQMQEKDTQIGTLRQDLEKSSREKELLASHQAQIEEKEKTIASLQASLDKEAKARARLAEQVGVLTGRYKGQDSSAYIRQIQVALANAGYEPGAVDGIMGSKTRKALRYFQKANGLDINGKVDKKTWLKLKIYLHRDIK